MAISRGPTTFCDYVMGIPALWFCLAFPWRWYPMYVSWKELSSQPEIDAKDGISPMLLGYPNALFGLIDVVCFPILVVTLLTWRCGVTINDLRDLRRRKAELEGPLHWIVEYRIAVVINFFTILKDLPFVAMLPLALLRAPGLIRRWRALAADEPGGMLTCDMRYSIAVECGKIVAMLLAAPLGMVILITVYRVPLLIANVRNLRDKPRNVEDDDTSIEDDFFSDVLVEILTQAMMVFCDAVCVPLMVFITITVFRAHYTIRLLQNSSSVEDPTFGLGGLRRRIVWVNFVMAVADIATACVSIVAFALSPPRLVVAVLALHRHYTSQRLRLEQVRIAGRAASSSIIESLSADFSFLNKDDESQAHIEHGPFICCCFSSIWIKQCGAAILDFLTMIMFCFAHVIPLRAVGLYRALLINTSQEGRRRRKASRLCAAFALTCDTLLADGLLSDHVAMLVNAKIAKVASDTLAGDASKSACFSPPLQHFLNKADSTIAKLRTLASTCHSRADIQESLKQAERNVCAVVVAFLRILRHRMKETVSLRRMLIDFGNRPISVDDVVSGAPSMMSPAPPQLSRVRRDIVHEQELDELISRTDEFSSDMLKPTTLEAAATEATGAKICSLASGTFSVTSAPSDASSGSDIDGPAAPLFAWDTEFRSNYGWAKWVRRTVDDTDDLIERTLRYFKSRIEERDVENELRCDDFKNELQEARQGLNQCVNDLQRLHQCNEWRSLRCEASAVRSTIVIHALAVFRDLFEALGLVIILVTVVRIVPMVQLMCSSSGLGHYQRRARIWPMVGQLVVDIKYLVMWAFVVVTIYYAMDMNVALLKRIVRERSLAVGRPIIFHFAKKIAENVRDSLSACPSLVDVLLVSAGTVFHTIAVPFEAFWYQSPTTDSEMAKYCLMLVAWAALLALTSVAASLSSATVTTMFLAVLGALILTIIALLLINPVEEIASHQFVKKREDLAVVRSPDGYSKQNASALQVVLAAVRLLVEAAQLASMAVVKHPHWGKLQHLHHIASFVTLNNIGTSAAYFSVAVTSVMLILVSAAIVSNLRCKYDVPLLLSNSVWRAAVATCGPVLAITVVDVSARLVWTGAEFRAIGVWCALLYIPSASLLPARFPAVVGDGSLRFHSQHEALAATLHCGLGLLSGAIPRQAVAYCTMQSVVLLVAIVASWRNAPFALNSARNSVHLFALAASLITLIAAVITDENDDKRAGWLGGALLVSAALAIALALVRIMCAKKPAHDFDTAPLVGEILAFEATLHRHHLLLAWNSSTRRRWLDTLTNSHPLATRPIATCILKLEAHVHIAAIKPPLFRMRSLWLRRLEDVDRYSICVTDVTLKELEERFQEFKNGTRVDDIAALLADPSGEVSLV